MTKYARDNEVYIEVYIEVLFHKFYFYWNKCGPAAVIRATKNSNYKPRLRIRWINGSNFIAYFLFSNAESLVLICRRATCDIAAGAACDTVPI